MSDLVNRKPINEAVAFYDKFCWVCFPHTKCSFLAKLRKVNRFASKCLNFFLFQRGPSPSHQFQMDVTREKGKRLILRLGFQRKGKKRKKCRGAPWQLEYLTAKVPERQTKKMPAMGGGHFCYVERWKKCRRGTILFVRKGKYLAHSTALLAGNLEHTKHNWNLNFAARIYTKHKRIGYTCCFAVQQ